MTDEEKEMHSEQLDVTRKIAGIRASRPVRQP